MVAKADARSSAFSVALAEEANYDLFEKFGRYDIEEAIEAVRAHAREFPQTPDRKGYDWIKWKILSRLNHTGSAESDPARWRWQDEVNLWHAMNVYAKGVTHGTIKDDLGNEVHGFGDELYVARTIVGKNPCVEERTAAYAFVCKTIDDARARILERNPGMEQAEANAMYPYPREGYWDARERWQRRADMERSHMAAQELTRQWGEV
jgi:hypothetical protein